MTDFQDFMLGVEEIKELQDLIETEGIPPVALSFDQARDYKPFDKHTASRKIVAVATHLLQKYNLPCGIIIMAGDNRIVFKKLANGEAYAEVGKEENA